MIKNDSISKDLQDRFNGIDLNTIDTCIKYLDSIKYLKYNISGSYYHGTYVSIYPPDKSQNIDTKLVKIVVSVFGPDTLTALQIAILLASS